MESYWVKFKACLINTYTAQINGNSQGSTWQSLKWMLGILVRKYSNNSIEQASALFLWTTLTLHCVCLHPERYWWVLSGNLSIFQPKVTCVWLMSPIQRVLAILVPFCLMRPTDSLGLKETWQSFCVGLTTLTVKSVSLICKFQGTAYWRMSL